METKKETGAVTPAKRPPIENSSDGYWINRVSRPRGYFMPRKYTLDCYEIYYLISGTCRLFPHHTIYHLKAGGLAVILPGIPHQTIYSQAQESERFALYFPISYRRATDQRYGGELFSQFKSCPVFTVEPGRREYVSGLLEHFAVEQQRADPYSRMLKDAYLAELLALLGRMEQAEAPTEPTVVEEQSIQEAARYICAHYKDPLTLDLVADAVHLSPACLSRKFKRLTGYNYKEYVSLVRLREASALLLETKLPIAEVACECGFPDANYFGDLFKKVKGVSPRTYRKNPQIL